MEIDKLTIGELEKEVQEKQENLRLIEGRLNELRRMNAHARAADDIQVGIGSEVYFFDIAEHCPGILKMYKSVIEYVFPSRCCEESGIQVRRKSKSDPRQYIRLFSGKPVNRPPSRHPYATHLILPIGCVFATFETCMKAGENYYAAWIEAIQTQKALSANAIHSLYLINKDTVPHA